MRLNILCALALIFAWVGLGSSEAALSQTLSDQTYRLSSTDWMFLTILVFLLLLFVVSPILLNMFLAYRHLSNMQTELREFIKSEAGDNFDSATTSRIIEQFINAEPNGVAGTGRSTMALTLSVILGISLMYLFTNKNIPSEISSIIKDIMLALVGALSSIVGFYFGGRAASENMNQTATTFRGDGIKAPSPAIIPEPTLAGSELVNPSSQPSATSVPISTS